MKDTSVSTYWGIGKKTKSKISWGTSSPEAGSSTSLCKHSNPLGVAYQSRRHQIDGEYFYLRINGCWIDQVFDEKQSVTIAQIKETSDRNSSHIDWKISLQGNLELMDMVGRWMGIIPPKKKEYNDTPFSESPSSNVLAIRKTLVSADHGYISKERKIAENKARSKQKLGKRDREAAKVLAANSIRMY